MIKKKRKENVEPQTIQFKITSSKEPSNPTHTQYAFYCSNNKSEETTHLQLQIIPGTHIHMLGTFFFFQIPTKQKQR